MRWTTFSTRSIRLASPPSVTNAIGSTSGSGTISSSTRTSSAVSVVAGRSSQATGGRKYRTARLAGAFIRLATMHGVPSGKRRRGRRWGSRAEPFRSERSRRVRGADVARVARSPPAAVGRVTPSDCTGQRWRAAGSRKAFRQTLWLRPNTSSETTQIPNSFRTSFRNRQSVPVAMILSGDDLIMPSSRSRNAQKRTASSAS